MKLSELIEKLEEIQEEYGDLLVENAIGGTFNNIWVDTGIINTVIIDDC